jgi:hypothetical protein
VYCTLPEASCPFADKNPAKTNTRLSDLFFQFIDG